MTEFSEKFKFSSWPNTEIPVVAAGVYAIWNKEELIYCGMSGRNIETAQRHGTRQYGLITRLNSHASGRLSGDQFCVYVANRLIIPTLKQHELPKFASGEYRLDALTKRYIHDHLSYQYALVETSQQARDLEKLARSGEVFGVKPMLNPM